MDYILHTQTLVKKSLKTTDKYTESTATFSLAKHFFTAKRRESLRNSERSKFNVLK